MKTGTILTLVLTLASCLSAYAQSESVLHSFSGGDGEYPLSALTYDPATHAYYGTSQQGGTLKGGTVFKLVQNSSGNWLFSRIYQFPATSTDGSMPWGVRLVAIDNGGALSALYGTTEYGGTNNLGTAFQLTPGVGGTWNETMLYSFSGPDGQWPLGGLVSDGKGSLYGMTNYGGTNNTGTVYQLKQVNGAWQQRVLLSLGGNYGGYPAGSLLVGKGGVLYGATDLGVVSGHGTAFQLTPPQPGSNQWTATVLHTFAGGTADGANPNCDLTIDATGSIYGTTSTGGANNGGIVFQLSPGSAGWTFNILYSFTGGADGQNPGAGVIFDDAGNLYGTVPYAGPYFGGAVYKLTPGSSSWTESSLWTFGGSGDGVGPFSGLLKKNGALFGTTQDGGTSNKGVIYSVVP
jgi:uncharacterized repeat protein (TIGR03803 family)